jgi:hypothetical protein
MVTSMTLEPTGRAHFDPTTLNTGANFVWFYLQRNRRTGFLVR